MKNPMDIQFGDVFECDDSLYILAQVGPLKVCLINLYNGNRWADPIAVKSNLDISKKEWEKITASYSFPDLHWKKLKNYFKKA